MDIIRTKVGDVFQIDIGEGNYAYCQVHKNAVVFFDLISHAPVQPATVVQAPIAFRISVRKSAFSASSWKKMGHLKHSEMFDPVKYFMQDASSGAFSIYIEDSPKSHHVPANIEDVIGLERVATWDANHVEERLRDYFAGRENIWSKSLAPRVH